MGRAGALSTSSFTGHTPGSGEGYALPPSPPRLCGSPSVQVSLPASPSLPSCLCVSLPVRPHFLLSLSISLPPCLPPTLHLFPAHFPCPWVSLHLSPPSSLGLLASSSLQGSLCLSVTPIFFLSVPRPHHLSPNMWGAAQDLIWTVDSAFGQKVFSPVLMSIMSMDVLPNGSHINTTPLCTSPEVDECYVTDVPQTRTQSAKQPIASARGPCLQITEKKDQFLRPQSKATQSQQKHY